jgi:hypothetical protein
MTPHTSVPYYRKNNWGNEQYYVYGPLTEPIRHILGQKTISKRQMELFTELGFAFVEIIKPDNV